MRARCIIEFVKILDFGLRAVLALDARLCAVPQQHSPGCRVPQFANWQSRVRFDG